MYLSELKFVIKKKNRYFNKYNIKKIKHVFERVEIRYQEEK